MKMRQRYMPINESWKCAQIFVCGPYLFWETNSFPRVKLSVNCKLWAIDNIQQQNISKHIFKVKWELLLISYPSNIFFALQKRRNIFQMYPSFSIWCIYCRLAIYLMTCKSQWTLTDYSFILRLLIWFLCTIFFMNCFPLKMLWVGE